MRHDTDAKRVVDIFSEVGIFAHSVRLYCASQNVTDLKQLIVGLFQPFYCHVGLGSCKFEAWHVDVDWLFRLFVNSSDQLRTNLDALGAVFCLLSVSG